MRLILSSVALSIALSLPLLPTSLQAQDTAPAEQPADAQRLTDVVEARQGLMTQIDTLILQLEELVAGGNEDDALRASEVGGMLASAFRAFPHLFPEITSSENLTAAGIDTVTSADPAIWEDFDSFYAMAHTAADRADAVFEAETIADIGPLAEQLRDSCEECHAQFLHYDPFAAMGLGTDVPALPPGIQ